MAREVVLVVRGTVDDMNEVLGEQDMSEVSRVIRCDPEVSLATMVSVMMGDADFDGFDSATDLSVDASARLVAKKLIDAVDGDMAPCREPDCPCCQVIEAIRSLRGHIETVALELADLENVDHLTRCFELPVVKGKWKRAVDTFLEFTADPVLQMHPDVAHAVVEVINAHVSSVFEGRQPPF